jgi:hypothetical protein
MTYDAGRKVTTLFGHGHLAPQDRPFGETWTSNGQHWVQTADTGPSTGYDTKTRALRVASLVYDPQRDKVVAFGSATCEWDGSTWVPRPRDVFEISRDRATFILSTSSPRARIRYPSAANT